MPQLSSPTLEHTPEALLEDYIVTAALRPEPIPVDSDEGKRLYRALAQHVWRRDQRPVFANDIRDLWERIDSIKRGANVGYGICDIHFWAAGYANSLGTPTVNIDPDTNKRLAAWLNDWPNVCILGQTGRGKSSTINRLFGIKMAEISHHSSCTRTVSDYRLVTGEFMNRPTGVVLWDVPGYGDERMPWERYVRLYRRMARKCDVVVFMLDNDRNFHQDLKMFRKLRKYSELESKLVVAINKSDLFYPFQWDEKAAAPNTEMEENIRERLGHVTDMLEIKNRRRVVAISALKNWNILGLLSAMVDAAGESKGAGILRASHSRHDNSQESQQDAELGRRFGINAALRSQFRSVIS